MTISEHDEDAVRALLRAQVADVSASTGLIARVSAGARRRRVVRRAVIPATAVLAAGCAAALAFTFGGGGTASVATAAAPPVGCPAQTSLPANWEYTGVRTKPPVPGATRTILPGTPVAAASCVVKAGNRTQLNATELAATVAALKSATLTSWSGVSTPCVGAAQGVRDLPLYLVFAYPDGTEFTVTAHPVVQCRKGGPVTWYVANGDVFGKLQSPALDALAAEAMG